MDGSGRKVLKNAMNAVVQQPDPTRRRLLQFSAGASAQVFLPGVPLSPVSIATELATPIASVVAVSENAAMFMAMALLRATYKLCPPDKLLNARTSYTLDDSEEEIRFRLTKVEFNINRLNQFFSFYTIFGNEALCAAQKTQGWKTVNRFHHEKLDSHSEIKKSTRGYDQGLFKESDIVTEETLLKIIFDLMGQVLDDDQWNPYKIDAKHYCYDRSAILSNKLDYMLFNHLATNEEYIERYGIFESQIASLTERQKIEILLETSKFSFGSYLHDIKAQNIGWFDVPDFFANRLAERACESPMVEEYTREFPDLFSAEEYFERRDRFVTEMDLFFARREMKKRLEMKQAHAEQKGAEPPVPLLRGVAAVRGTFSKLGGHVSGFLRTAFTEKTKDIIDPVVQPDEPSAPLSLGYQPVSDGIGTIDLSGLQHASEAESIKRTPPQP